MLEFKTHMVNYTYKIFPETYPLARVHPLRSDGRTDRQTNDNHANSSTLPKYGRLKIFWLQEYYA